MARSRNEAERSCSCGRRCLGPMTFNSEVLGRHVTLSRGACRATRDAHSFRHGLVFSSRPVRVGEKVCIRVERCILAWHGALRIGFTTVPPGSRHLPSLAIPDLTDKPGYCAQPVSESACKPGSEVRFWMTSRAKLCYQASGRTYCMQTDMDLSQQPLWAMIDVYGQTSTVLLLGSVKKGIFQCRTSCPAPVNPPTSSECGYLDVPESLQRPENNRVEDEQWKPDMAAGHVCVVCLSNSAAVTVRCGHRCMCFGCATRVISELEACPLCRHPL
ncbi:E3 ubiquitin-protein ligase NEURL3 [Denticeps clupeoides]|uniref:E3 ubiquitin-protein ligase NEURL3 n=1 Tax=Denticeps clupeoides TaxID=299321 RepID=UPI0010A4CD40|nr:E3 ubiquitin-protein ligase NEURL3-like [Denticeps clupeoides]